MRNNIIKLVFVILISMVFCSFFQIPNLIINIMYYNALSESVPVGYVILRICIILLSLCVFGFGLLSLFNKQNKVLWTVITICILLVLIGINVWSIIEYISYIKPGDLLSIKAANYSNANNVASLIVNNIINTAAIVFAVLTLNLKEGENKNEEKRIEELC